MSIVGVNPKKGIMQAIAKRLSLVIVFVIVYKFDEKIYVKYDYESD